MIISPLVVDVLLGCVIIFFAISGWKYGLIKTLGSLVGLALSIIAGIWGIRLLDEYFSINFAAHPVWMIIGFFVLALVASALLGWIVNLLDLARRVLSILPFIGILNSFFGFVVGVIEGIFVVGAFAYLCQTF